ncbi:hypothetical protein SAMN05216302_101235 [Nitrosomonas aestuarii]|uniref:Uncharacterized protein n=1 Tax=Nitrosomonas aestuarii TaxID=52441 RepID=A0A1I4BJR3_9PROT|nr:hypothetical protein SAMN05216302_101235 [Nitrosomonas aestuarii]
MVSCGLSVVEIPIYLNSHLNGTYIGKETTNAGLHIEGFGFDEVSNTVWVHSIYAPDLACSTCNGQIGNKAHYIQKPGGFTDVTPPGVLLPLFQSRLTGAVRVLD